jgi:hypothetical protein
MRETRQPGEDMGGVDAITWSIVLRTDRFTKPTVNGKSSRKCSPLNKRKRKHRSTSNPARLKEEDTPWNRCC